MTEIKMEDDSVDVNVENVSVELGEQIENVDVTLPSLYGLANIDVVSPLHFSALSGTLDLNESNSSQNGYLSAADWQNFNSKQPIGNYISGLTGDAVAAGPGNAVITLANVNSNVGTFNNLTVNSKGQVTAANNINYQPALAALDSGKILFGDSTTTPSTDSNLVWDNSNKRLGLGVSPSKTLDVSGDVRTTNTFYGGSGGFSQTGATLSTFGSSNKISLKSDVGYSFNFGSNGNTQWQTDLNGNLLPSVDNVSELGSSTNQIKNGYFRNKIGANSYGSSSWAPSASLHINALANGTTGSAAIKITGGTTLLSVVEEGAIEYNGTHLYFTIGIQRLQIDRQTAKAKTVASDANLSISAVNSLTELPTPTANRTIALPLPLLYTGEEIIIWNKSTSSSFTWAISTYTKDAAGTAITTLANTTVYRFVCDGSVWLKTN